MDNIQKRARIPFSCTKCLRTFEATQEMYELHYKDQSECLTCRPGYDEPPVDWKGRCAKLVQENDNLSAEIAWRKQAHDKCATGGNSLASVIIGWNLPEGWQTWTYAQASDFMYGLYGEKSNMAYERYEVWLCWKSIREACQLLEVYEND